MRQVVSASLFFLLLIIVSVTIAGSTSPWPDPAERAAFQRGEWERRTRWSSGLLEREAAYRSSLQDRYDVVYYRLALDLRDVNGQWIVGDATARIVVTDGPLDSLLFDLRDTMGVDSVLVDGAPAGIGQQGFDLLLVPAAPLPTGHEAEVRIFYQGHPAHVGSFGWATHNGTPLIWSLSEPEGGREWWPSKDRPDDKADSLDVLLRGPDWMVSTANGLLDEVTVHEDGSRTYHWKHRYPITTYLVCVTATNFVRIEDWYVPPQGDPMLIEHFVYPENLAAAEEDLSITPEAIGAFADLFDAYPFLEEKYGHTLFPWSGAMEHQTNTSYGAILIRGDHTYDWILVHELAHQWWGDMTSPADWRDIWLNEGFASYGEALWFEYLYGFDGLHDYMVYYQAVSDPSGPIYDPGYLFDGNTVYNKGAWALHMLRGVLGDDLFYAAFAEYRARTAYRSTTTAEFQSIVEEVSGQDLDWFFQPWIYGINRPHYEVSFLPIGGPEPPAVAVHLDQTQTEWGFFPMPVELQIDLQGGGSVRERIWNDPDHLDVEIGLPAAPVAVAVDPDDWILKEVATAAYTMHITTTDLPEGTEGTPYEATVRGRGGTPPYTWFVVDALPPGIDLDPQTGLLSGTAPDSGTYVFTIRLTDQTRYGDEQLYRWTVLPVALDAPERDLPSRLRIDASPLPARDRIRFHLEGPISGAVSLTIYDLSGRRVRRLWDGPMRSGSIGWDGRDDRGREISSGIYLARLQAKGGGVTRRIVWVR